MTGESRPRNRQVTEEVADLVLSYGRSAAPTVEDRISALVNDGHAVEALDTALLLAAIVLSSATRNSTWDANGLVRFFVEQIHPVDPQPI